MTKYLLIFLTLLGASISVAQTPLRIELNRVQQLLANDQAPEAEAILLQLEQQQGPALTAANIEEQFYHTLRARVWGARQQYELAVPHLRRALELVPLHRDSAAQALLTHWVAREVYEQAEEYTLALEQAQILASIYAVDGVNNQVDLARNYHKMGQFARAKGNAQQALSYFEKAFQSYQLAPKTTTFDRANIHKSLALAAGDLKQVEQQQLHLKQALELALTIPTERGAILYASLLKDLGDYYFQRRQGQEAMSSYYNYVEATEKVHGRLHVKTGLAYMNLGLAYAKGNNLPAAEHYFEEAIAIKIQVHGQHHPNVAVAYGNLALLLQKMGNPKEAVAKSFQSFKANTSTYNGKDATLPLLPIIQEQSILQPLTAISNLQTRTTAYYDLYKKEKKLEWLRLAQESCLAQLAIFDKYRNQLTDVQKIQLLHKDFMPFQLGVELSALLHQKTKEVQYIEQSFELAERAKDARLTNILSDGQSLHYGGIPDSLRIEEKRLRKRLVALNRRLVEVPKGNPNYGELQNQLLGLTERHRLLLVELEREYPNYYQLSYHQEVATIKNLQINILGKGETLLAYYIPYPKAYIWTIDQSSAQLTQLELDSSYQNNVHALRAALSQADQEVPSELSYYFYKKFVAPDLNGSAPAHLYILPDHWLCHLPFEVFETVPAKANNSAPAYLLRQTGLSYAYSASLLLYTFQLRFARNWPIRLLGMAPSYALNSTLKTGTPRSEEDLLRRQYLTPLPNATREIETLQEQLVGIFIYGADATEEAFKRRVREYGLLHLAAHALLDPQQPINSALAFAENTALEEDNFLNLAEIVDLPLQAQLVALTACQTGYGKFEYGEGLATLTRAFMYAGAPSVVANLWPINASSSAIIMADFYSQLQNGLPKGEAMRQAKLNYLQQVEPSAQHPKYWASLIVFGNNAPLDLSPYSFFTFSNLFLAGFTLILIIIMLAMIRRRHKRPNIPTTYDFD